MPAPGHRKDVPQLAHAAPQSGQGVSAGIRLRVEDLTGNGPRLRRRQQRHHVSSLGWGVPSAAGHVAGDEELLLGVVQPVSVGPGLTQLTVMSWSASALANVAVIWCRAPLVAASAISAGAGPRCWPEVNNTIRPP